MPRVGVQEDPARGKECWGTTQVYAQCLSFKRWWGGWGHRQGWQQLAVPPAALTGLGLAAATVTGPHGRASCPCCGARRGRERVHPEEECGLGGAVVSAGALGVQPAVHQQPPPSMAEKPQIQLFIKVRGVLRSVPQASGQPWQPSLAALQGRGWAAPAHCSALVWGTGQAGGQRVGRGSGTG